MRSNRQRRQWQLLLSAVASPAELLQQQQLTSAGSHVQRYVSTDNLISDKDAWGTEMAKRERERGVYVCVPCVMRAESWEGHQAGN